MRLSESERATKLEEPTKRLYCGVKRRPKRGAQLIQRQLYQQSGTAISGLVSQRERCFKMLDRLRAQLFRLVHRPSPACRVHLNQGGTLANGGECRCPIPKLAKLCNTL